MVLKPNY